MAHHEEAEEHQGGGVEIEADGEVVVASVAGADLALEGEHHAAVLVSREEVDSVVGEVRSLLTVWSLGAG